MLYIINANKEADIETPPTIENKDLDTDAEFSPEEDISEPEPI